MTHPTTPAAAVTVLRDIATMLEGYADSYDSMARQNAADPRVEMSSVACDIRQNMKAYVLVKARALAAHIAPAPNTGWPAPVTSITIDGVRHTAPAQGSVDGASIDTPEFRQLTFTYATKIMRGSVPESSEAWGKLVEYVDSRAHIAERAAIQPAGEASITSMCARKTSAIEAEGYRKTGYVLMADDPTSRICVSDQGAVSWFTRDQWNWLMHNRDHVEFRWPKPIGADPAPAPVEAGELHDPQIRTLAVVAGGFQDDDTADWSFTDRGMLKLVRAALARKAAPSSGTSEAEPFVRRFKWTPVGMEQVEDGPYCYEPAPAPIADEAPNLDEAINTVVAALQSCKGWMRDYADAIIRDAIDRVPFVADEAPASVHPAPEFTDDDKREQEYFDRWPDDAREPASARPAPAEKTDIEAARELLAHFLAKSDESCKNLRNMGADPIQPPEYDRIRELLPRLLGAPDASPAPQVVAPSEELEFNATRLRNVARLAGIENMVPQDDETLDGARGSVLGMIAGALRNRATLAPQAPEPEPFGYVLQHDWRTDGWSLFKGGTKEQADRMRQTYPQVHMVYLAPVPPAVAPEQSDQQAAALDRQYLAGYDSGFMAGERGDHAHRAAVQKARTEAIRALISKEIPAQTGMVEQTKGGDHD